MKMTLFTGLAALVVVGLLIIGGVSWWRGHSAAPITGTATSTDMNENRGVDAGNVRILRRPDSLEIQSVMCRNRQEGESSIDVVIGDDIRPACIMVGDDQDLRIVNERRGDIVMTIDRLPPQHEAMAETRIPAGTAARIDTDFGQYLSRGVHRFRFSTGQLLEVVVLE